MRNLTKNKFGNLKVAIVHDFFREYGGAERVVEEFCKLFPQAHIYTALLNPKNLKVHWDRLKDYNFKVSWFGKIPLLRSYPSLFRFLTPYIWESFDLSGYELVISSSGWFMCKGVITRADSLHISYIHHQNKFLTYYETPDDWQQNFFKRAYGYMVGTPLRIWDYVGSQRPDILVANSQETRQRINKYYRRDATVIYPPVRDPGIKFSEKQKATKDYYITVNRLSKPKHVEVLIEAAKAVNITLYVVGTGREYSALRSIANKNIIFTGEVSDTELSRLYFGARGFMFAAVDEEFGIAPVEAMMYGLPVIAYKSGGLKETIENGKNGYLVDSLLPDSYVQALRKLEKNSVLYNTLARNAYLRAKKYSQEEFRKKFLELVLNHI